MNTSIISDDIRTQQADGLLASPEQARGVLQYVEKIEADLQWLARYADRLPDHDRLSVSGVTDSLLASLGKLRRWSKARE